MTRCVYCRRPGPFADEHVFTRALSGDGEDWLLKDIVCKKCNGLFSRWERAWTSEPMNASARIYQGPVGRTRRGQAFTTHPSEQIFLEAPGEPTSFEADILPGFAPRLRVQIIDLGTRLLSEAGAVEDFDRFKRAYAAFTATPEITIAKRPEPGPRQYTVALLSLDTPVKIERVERRAKPGAAWHDKFPSTMKTGRHPRMSIDAFGRLRFRTLRLAEIPQLLEHAFEAGPIRSGSRDFQPGKYQLGIHSVYELPKVHRAVAKTLVNYMIDRLGREWAEHLNFRPLLDYCIGHADDAADGPFVQLIRGPLGIAPIDALPIDRHALALYCDGRHVAGAVKTYGHFLHVVRLGDAPAALGPFSFGTWIDFGGVGRVPVGG